MPEFSVFCLFVMITVLGSLAMVLFHNRRLAEIKFGGGGSLPSRNLEIDELRRHVAEQNAIIAEMRTLLHQQAIALDDARVPVVTELRQTPPPAPRRI